MSVNAAGLLYFVLKCNVLYREYVLCACDVLANEGLICRVESSAFWRDAGKKLRYIFSIPFLSPRWRVKSSVGNKLLKSSIRCNCFVHGKC